MTSSSNELLNYDSFAKWLHWIMALMVLVMIAVGTYVSGLEKTDPGYKELVGMHKSFGSVFMLLAVIRIIWSRIKAQPKLPEVLSLWEKFLSRSVTALLYVLMIIIPLSGYAQSNLFGFPVSLFGFVDMPQIFDKNVELAKLAGKFHMTMVYLLVVLVGTHIAGALKHRFIDSAAADVLPRMTSDKFRTNTQH